MFWIPIISKGLAIKKLFTSYKSLRKIHVTNRKWVRNINKHLTEEEANTLIKIRQDIKYHP